MNKDIYIFEVAASRFDELVIANSRKLPVVVLFMGVWSEHCMLVDSIFRELAAEFAGQFIFAQLDVDENRELMQQYQVENLPTLIVFEQGEPKRVEVGELNVDDARALLRDFNIYSEADELRLQARQQHVAGDTEGAVQLLTKAIQLDPGNTRVAMDMLQIFIDVGALENAQGLFNRLPEQEQQSELGQSLNGQLLFATAAAKTSGADALQQQLQQQPDDLQARFDLAMCLMATHQGTAAMDQLLLVLEQDPGFKQEAAREMLVTIIAMFRKTHTDIAQQYQRRLSSLLAQ